MVTSRIAPILAPALLLGLIFFSCAKNDAEQKPGIQVVASVNGEALTLAQFQERYSRAGFTSDSEASLELKRDFLNHLIERMMMLAEARRKGIAVSQAELSRRVQELLSAKGQDRDTLLSRRGIDLETWKSDIRQDMMIEELLVREVNQQVTVPASEVEAYYRSNRSEFSNPAQVRVRQIVLATEDEARKVVTLLRQRKDFATLARDYSNAPEAAQGGDLGWFGKGDMPEAFNVVFSLHVGGISDVVKSPYGFHIFKLEAKQRAGRITLHDAFPEIVKKLRQEKINSRYAAWLQELRSKTKLEVNYHLLEQ